MGLQTVGFVVFDNFKMNSEFISSNYCLLNCLQYMSVSYKNYFSVFNLFLIATTMSLMLTYQKKGGGFLLSSSLGRLAATWFLLGLCHLKTDGVT